ncbi:hypothetical protein [Kineosporia sp. NBRC 101731]|uniref:hypothetical protein n=1 Tax=Kineosporia sp. NBRC 101731 TaxID=3032199 RepID=UPI0024A15E89|nr:hypothetical protein [Kineosporia sp. NBRC 101731]GLY31600.1 hypothetical protein Kisp02_49650 [Kineosporia sp. NBRC 101731]
MTVNWPQLPVSVAEARFAEIAAETGDLYSASRDPQQVYSPVGSRVSDQVVQKLIDEITEVAAKHGFPQPAKADARIQFDRDAAFVLGQQMNISWADAGNRAIWSFMALVPLPHITRWRFGTGYDERWIASDLTRHTWSRLWWHATVFAEDRALLGALTESDLNQLLERRSIGGDPRLTREVARAVVAADGSGVPRRLLIRDATRRVRRWLAFLDVRSLDDAGMKEMCSLLVEETIQHVRRNPDASILESE